MNIRESTRQYEDWLRRQLKGDIVQADIAEKHEKMRESAFTFLRATYWRWAETILDICPDLAVAPAVLGVGDLHLENYGTWRDADGRLVWGINDFDESARMPYALDLLRLATSALIATGKRGASAEAISGYILEGYALGLKAPNAIVLDRDYRWLRELLVVSEKQRAKFWQKILAAPAKRAPADYRSALVAAMPVAGLALKTSRRTAGAGSLGRPRWVGIAEWRGAPVVREAKALVPSAWHRGRDKESAAPRAGKIASGHFRPIDPWFSVKGPIAMRRLSPNNRKVEADGDLTPLLLPDMLRAMGLDVANTHLGCSDCRAAIARDLKRRPRGWLAAHAKKAAAAVSADYAAWRG